MATISTNFNIPTSKQIPDHSIMDINGKQVYLGNQFAVTLGATALSGTSEQALILLSNPMATSNAQNTKSLFVDLKKIISLTAADSVIMRAYIAPTAAAGSAATIQNLRPASGTASIANASTAPTASANGTLVDVLASLAFDPKTSDQLLVLDPGQSMLITAQCSASLTLAAQLSWFEL